MKMKIYDERKAKTIPFNKLDVGDVFIDEEDYIAMKIYPVKDEKGEICNAVILGSGVPYNYMNTEVELVKVSLTIESAG